MGEEDQTQVARVQFVQFTVEIFEIKMLESKMPTDGERKL